ncbi:MAG: V-type ATP synthase subunit A, partial [Oscillospiraceae bacterium]
MNEKTTGAVIEKVAGPLIVASGMRDCQMYDVVRVSDKRLIGEIIELRGDKASIQVYEETAGLGPGEPVYSTGEPLSVELAPGLIGGIFDGIQRPLEAIYELQGDRITRGVDVPKLSRDAKWEFKPIAKVGDQLISGDTLGTVEETPAVIQKIMVPPNVRGKLVDIKSGEFTITETIAVLELENGEKLELPMLQKWPVRRGRPFAQKLTPTEPMITGQRTIDTLFPISKGGVAA